MSLFQFVSMWSLRALLLWGAVEAGARLYETGLDHAAALTRLAGHDAAMTRLGERAQARETEADAAAADLARLRPPAWTLVFAAEETPAQAAARALREELIQLGAEAAVVEAVEAANVGDVARVSLSARWREPVETAPLVLHALADARPELGVEQLALERGERVLVEANFAVEVRARARQVASR